MERVWNHRQASLRDASDMFETGLPWTEVHGYHRSSLRDDTSDGIDLLIPEHVRAPRFQRFTALTHHRFTALTF